MACVQILPHRSAGLVKAPTEKDATVVDLVYKGFGRWNAEKWEERYEAYSICTSTQASRVTSTVRRRLLKTSCAK